MRWCRVVANLKAHDLRGADLTGARFLEGALAGADLRGTRGLEEVSCRVVISGLPSPPSVSSPIAELKSDRGLRRKPRRESTGSSVNAANTGKTTALCLYVAALRAAVQTVLLFEDGLRSVQSRERPQLDLWTEFATFLSLFGYDRPRELLSSSEDFSAVKDDVWAAFAAALRELDCLIALDDVEAPEPVEFVKFLLKSPEVLSATIAIATSKQFVEAGTVVPDGRSFLGQLPAHLGTSGPRCHWLRQRPHHHRTPANSRRCFRPYLRTSRSR